MNIARFRDLLSCWDVMNIPRPLGLELRVKEYDELKADLQAIPLVRYAAGFNITAEGLTLYGVDIKPRRCTCGAHPEDQK